MDGSMYKTFNNDEVMPAWMVPVVKSAEDSTLEIRERRVKCCFTDSPTECVRHKKAIETELTLYYLVPRSQFCGSNVALSRVESAAEQKGSTSKKKIRATNFAKNLKTGKRSREVDNAEDPQSRCQRYVTAVLTQFTELECN